MPNQLTEPVGCFAAKDSSTTGFLSGGSRKLLPDLAENAARLVSQAFLVMYVCSLT
jgi:hypothetical protein